MVDHRDDERIRREQAQAHRDEIVAGTGRPMEGVGLEQMVSVRLDAEAVSRLRVLADRRKMSLSAVIREALDFYAFEAARTSDVRWIITGYQGTVDIGTERWIESPSTRSAVRDLSGDLTPT